MVGQLEALWLERRKGFASARSPCIYSSASHGAELQRLWCTGIVLVLFGCEMSGEIWSAVHLQTLAARS